MGPASLGALIEMQTTCWGVGERGARAMTGERFGEASKIGMTSSAPFGSGADDAGPPHADLDADATGVSVKGLTSEGEAGGESAEGARASVCTCMQEKGQRLSLAEERSLDCIWWSAGS